MSSKVILIVRVCVLGHKYVLGPSQTHFSLRLGRESESGPKHIYAREHKLYCYIDYLPMIGKFAEVMRVPSQKEKKKIKTLNLYRAYLVPDLS